MEPDTLVETLNFFYLLAFAVGLLLGAAFTLARLLRYRRKGERPTNAVCPACRLRQ